MARPDPNCPLIGTWKLAGWDVLVDGPDPYTSPPDWPAVQGQIMYTPEGTMSMQMSNVERAPFDVEGPYGGSDVEKALAFDDFRAYCGTYRYEGTRVVHIVEQSIFPNHIGTDQERLVTLDGDKLILTNVERTLALTWLRVGSGDG